MSTDLSTNVKTVDFPALSADSRALKVISQNLDGEPMRETDLVHVKTPLGGATQWSIDNNGNVETTDEIVGLLVAVGKKGVLWPSEDPSESRPVLVTNDLLVGHLVSRDLGSIDPAALEKYRLRDGQYDWVALSNGPEFGYGNSRSGSGKRVKETRVLAILRQGETWPILVSVGPGSLRNILPFLKRLPCFFHEAVVGLRLTRAKGKGGQPYSQIVPRLVGQISEEQGLMAEKVYAEPLRRMFSEPPSSVSLDISGDDE